MEIFELEARSWKDIDGNLIDVLAGIAGTGPSAETSELSTQVDFGAGAARAVIQFDFQELDTWEGENFNVQIGQDLLDLGQFWHDRNDLETSGTIAGQSGAITWSVNDGFTNQDLGGNPAFADERHFVQIVAEGLVGVQTISFGSTLDQSVEDENWRVSNLTFSLDLDNQRTSTQLIQDFDGGVHNRAATGARSAEVTGLSSGYGGTTNWYDVRANGDGAWGHGDYWLSLTGVDLSQATTLKLDTVMSGAASAYSVYVRDAQNGWTAFGKVDGGSASIDLGAHPDEKLDNVNAMVLRIHESDMTDTPDQTAWTRMHLNDISLETPDNATLAGNGETRDLGRHEIEGTFDIAPQALHATADGAGNALEIVWVSSGHGGTPILNNGDIAFDIADGFIGRASFEYILSNGQGDFARHQATFNVDGEMRWSDAFADTGQDGTVVIGAGQRVLLDQDANIGTLIIDGGQLIAEDVRDIALSVDRVLIMDGGLFQVGTEDALFQHDFTLTLTGDDAGYDLDLTPYRDCEVQVTVQDDGPCVATGGEDCRCMRQIVDNDAYLMAMGEGSRIEIHAADAEKETWTQLRQTADAGDTWLRLAERTDWQVGDLIAIASTDFDMEQAEESTIVEVRNGGRDVRLDSALSYRHYGEVETYDNGKRGEDQREWNLDMRAEVALLSRNVTITGDENAHEDGFGGHIMVMQGGDMRIEGAEITRMGQEGILGRYGAHWDSSGDATGDYLRNNSFHEIYNKGITWHGVQNTYVGNNVVYGTIGHSYFMEDAAEFGNRLIGNLGFGTRAAVADTALTTADIDQVSTYWIGNPNNVFEGNHAAGSEFAGFWIAPSDPHGDSAASGLYDDLTGRTDPIQHFVGNTAHSNTFNLGIEGHVADGEIPTFENTRYEATDDWEIRDFTAFKSDDRSIWARSIGGTFTDIKSADNTRATFFSFTNTMTDSLIVGRSVGNADGSDVSHRGHSIYDGPSGIQDVHFANFNGVDQAIQLNDAAEKSTTHFASGVTWENVAEANKVDFSVQKFAGADGEGATFFDHAWTTSLIDLDGSITGTERATITAMIDDPDGTKVNVSPDALARADWSAWVGDQAQIGWMRIIPSYDFPQSEATNGENVTTWYDIFRSDGEQLLNARPTNDVIVNAGFAVQDDLAYSVRLHELPETMRVAFKGLTEGTTFFYTFQNMPADVQVHAAAEVGSRAALEGAKTTSFYREDQDLVFKVVADRRTHLTPETDQAFARDKTFGTYFTIDTGLENDSPNVLADFERGVDGRGTTLATDAQVSQVRAAWGYKPDAINWWDVTANGDGVWGFGDYSFDLGATQDWTPFKKLNIDAILGGVKAGYEVLLRDATDGLVSVGTFDSGMARVYLDDVDARFLDEVEGILIRVDERDLTGDVEAAGAFTRVHVQGLYLDAGDGPRFDFLDTDAISSLGAQDAGVIDARAQAGSDPMARNTWAVAANGDGVWGHGDMRFAVNNENWQGEDWLRIDTIIQGIDMPYTVYLRDKDDGYAQLGQGGQGASYFDLDQVDDRYLDRIDQILLRVHEKNLAPDADTESGFARLTLTAIDTVQGDITLADFERGVDLRGSTSAVNATASDVRAAWQDRADSINYWDVHADGDGQFGHADYTLDLGQTMDWRAVFSLKLDTVMGGAKADYEVILHDAGDGAISLGKFGEGLVGAALMGVEDRFLDEVDAITIRTSERDLTSDPDAAGAFTRVHLFGLYLSDDQPPVGGADHFVFHSS